MVDDWVSVMRKNTREALVSWKVQPTMYKDQTWDHPIYMCHGQNMNWLWSSIPSWESLKWIPKLSVPVPTY
jgi:hypothetical protein